ncbi:Brp/Blh family beta-carotene 15,15'-dioxygenase [Winogradskyella sp.]|uniref:Brp/Blh family beta-carotene 15,15'-dioxygenase n=1 Tax=Winogradskyella sp. TaxID=1883156 RepID=UPI00260E75A4|nr:Brp/Blh family beta-carotene 15,15'-dioxygenase [Winogradskyella sp.]
MKFPVFNLILTVFLFWLTTQISTSYEEYLSYFFILTIGIIHGSNDISLIRVVKKQKKLSVKYLLFYIGLVLLNITAFLILPILALVFFVFISCYHFGEQHFHNQMTHLNLWARLLFLSYGCLIFGLLFYFNSESTSLIINELIGYALTEQQFLWFMGFGIVSTIILYGLNLKNFGQDTNHFQELFLIFLFAILFKLAALLWAFAIYFVVWHSIPSLMDQIKTLYGESNKVNIVQYIKSSFVYWLISIVGLVLLYVATTYFSINFVTVFFAFLAAITVPHVIVMYFLYRN